MQPSQTKSPMRTAVDPRVALDDAVRRRSTPTAGPSQPPNPNETDEQRTARWRRLCDAFPSAADAEQREKWFLSGKDVREAVATLGHRHKMRLGALLVKRNKLRQRNAELKEQKAQLETPPPAPSLDSQALYERWKASPDLQAVFPRSLDYIQTELEAAATKPQAQS